MADANTELGSILLIGKGEYNSQTVYDLLNVVTSNGNSYVSKIEDNVGNDLSNTNYWQIMAEKGDNALLNGYNVVLITEGDNIEITQNQGTLEISAIQPTKTSELTNDSNYAKTNTNNNFSAGQTINGTLTVNGDITQNGTSYITHAEQVKSTKDNIFLRDGATGGLTAGQMSGFEIVKYDGTNNGIIGIEADGTLRIGDKGDEQAVATRAEVANMTNNEVVIWDGTNLNFKTGNTNDIVRSVKPLTGITLDSTLIPGKVYTLGEVSSVDLNFPTSAVAGEEILVRFYSGATPTTVTTSANVVGDIVVPIANSYYMLLATYDSEKWIIQYLEY